MKNLIMVIFTIFLVACGKGGAPESSGGNVVDTTPHDYAVGFTVLADYGTPHDVTFHQICNFGFAGFRDEIVSFSESAASAQGGVGCAASKNYTVDITNTGTVNLHIWINIDGVYQPSLDMVVAPGQTQTFQRGY